MRKLLATATLIVATGALFSSSVSAQGNPSARADSCFFQRDVSSFSAPDDHTVYFRVGVRDYYKVDVADPCTNMNWAQAIELQNRSGGPTICSPLDAQLIVHLSGMPTQFCPVTGFRKLTVSEVGALGKNKP